jgi:hypothetical protein
MQLCGAAVIHLVCPRHMWRADVRFILSRTELYRHCSGVRARQHELRLRVLLLPTCSGLHSIRNLDIQQELHHDSPLNTVPNNACICHSVANLAL